MVFRVRQHHIKSNDFCIPLAQRHLELVDELLVFPLQALIVQVHIGYLRLLLLVVLARRHRVLRLLAR